MPTNFYYTRPGTPERALARLHESHRYIAIDTETVNIADKRCIGIGMAISPTEAYYFPMGDFEKSLDHPGMTDAVADLEQALDSGTPKPFFNAPFDIEVLDRAACPFPRGYLDVSIACHVSGLPNALDEVIGLMTGKIHTTIEQILPKGKTMLDIPTAVTARKCMNDCTATWEIAERLDIESWDTRADGFTWKDAIGNSHHVNTRMIDCYRVDAALLPVLRKMGKRGIRLRQGVLNYWYERLSEECYTYERICQSYGFKVSSNEQVGMILADRGSHLPFTKGKKLQLKTDEETLEELSDPLARVVLEWRKRNKLLTTYICPWLGRPVGKSGRYPPRDEWEEQERAYTTYRLDLATGRLASSDRNLQNVPGTNYDGLKPYGAYNMREVFAPDRGVWTWGDFSQIEMRVFAYKSQDPVMMDVYSRPKGDPEGDIHWITQRALFPETTRDNDTIRTRSKTFNFAMIYFAKAMTLARRAKIPLSAAAKWREDWLELYGVGHDWMEMTAYEGVENGYGETEYGRRMVLPDPAIFGYEHMQNCAVNYPIQGTAADIIKRAMLLCDDWGFDFPLQVHDELVIDGDVPLLDYAAILSRVHPDIYTPIDVKGPAAVWG